MAALLAASACASGAGAAESFSLPLASSGSLSGEHVFDVVTIEGTLTVPPLDAAAAGSGTLHLKANRIILGATGVIDATGAGHRGELDGSAGGPGAGGTPTFGDDQTSQPGGGGSHRGKTAKT